MSVVSPVEAEFELERAIRAFSNGDVDSANAALARLLDSEPEHAGGLQLKGAIYYHQGDIPAAIGFFRRALNINSNNPEGWFQLGQLYELSGEAAEAKRCYENCLARAPAHVECLNNLGTLKLNTGEFTEALDHLVQAATLGPEGAFHFANLGNAYSEVGAHEDAIQCYTRALELDPTLLRAYSNLLLCLNYQQLVSPHEVFEAHKQYGERLSRMSKLLPPRQVAIDSLDKSIDASAGATVETSTNVRQKISVGFVSADFRHHPVAWFFESLLMAHDKKRFNIFCYSNNSLQDATSDQLRKHCHLWRRIDNLNDQEAALTIRGDNIDILVDLGGHTENDRLGVFACKPAPIQVTWLGYPNTTGLTQMDYRITDAITDPPGLTESLHTEQLIRLEHGFLCYRGDDSFPQASQPPCIENGYITFGCFNNIAKITPSMIEIWSKLLKQVPFSKLVLKAKHFGDLEFKREFQQRFARLGVSRNHLVLLRSSRTQAEHMAAYNQIDIALDTFPYNGTTTTFESLWMGVPVITLCGDTHVSRVSASILHQLQLDAMVARDQQSYINNAVTVAKKQLQLAELKTNLRDRLKASSLMDADGFARKMEAVWDEVLIK